MYDTFFVLGIVFAILGGAFLIASVTMFFGLDIPALLKNSSGKLEQRQIEEIRRNSRAIRQRGKVNVFEDLEKHAKVRRSNTSSLVLGTTSDKPSAAFSSPIPADSGTTVLSQGARAANPNFIIEKNIVFVSTNEVI